MIQANYNPLLTARYQAFQANGVGTTSPFVGSGAQGISIPDWINQRRTYLLNQLASVNAAFAITSNSGNNFSTAQNYVTLTGTAPVDVRTIRVNGVAYDITWPSINAWTLRVPLSQSVNNLSLLAYDATGKLIAGLSDSITVTFTGSVELPQTYLAINEVMFNPATPNAEFVEIHNRSTLTTFDLSGYRLNGVDFIFPEGTVIPPNGFVVAVENLSAFQASYGFAPPVAGVYNGTLDNGGETLQLIKPGATPAADLLIDQVTYDDDAPWPTSADGFGPSLQLIDPTRDNNRVANWAAVSGGSSGQTGSLIGMTDTWKYNQSGSDLGTAWRQPAYIDTAWPSGAALHYVEDAALPAAKNTALTYTSPQQTTFYFRKSFNFTGNPALTTLTAQLIVDDGAIVYLNGVEVLRLGLPADPVAFDTFANRSVGDAAYEGPFILPPGALVQGANVLAVEVHQVNATSSDVVFGLSLEANSNAGTPYTPGAPNSTAGALAALPLLWLNEVQPVNATGMPDRFNQRDPWVELYNSGSTALTLDGFYLSDSYTNLTRWAFPAGTTINPGQFRLVWLDAQPAQTGAGELHASFRIPPENGAVALVQIVNSQPIILDYLNYGVPGADKSYGAFPDATPAKRTRFYIPTPGDSNSDGHPEVPVTINEWMAGNTSTITDPLDGQFDDWFELHNSSADPVDLSDFTLTDNLANPDKWTIPTGTVIPAGGFLLVWADEQPEQNGYSSELHADFKLSLSGETLGLFAPNGILIDSVLFPPQTNNISEGRWPDASTTRYFMTTATPGAPNVIDNPVNQAPVLRPISNQAINEGVLLSFNATASDPDSSQTLRFSLDPGAPSGSAINPDSGLFTWIPAESQGPGTYPITIRVTDNGQPSLSDNQTITVSVSEVNRPPILTAIGSQAVAQQTLLTFNTVATDPDIPANTLSYSLDEGAPTGAAIHPTTGVFTWTPSSIQPPGLYSVTLIVSDNGSPALNASETVQITVRAPDALLIQSVDAAPNGTVTIAWNSQVGRQYRLEFKDSVQSPSWSIAGDYTATTTTTTATHTTTGSPQRLYRVRQLD